MDPGGYRERSGTFLSLYRIWPAPAQRSGIEHEAPPQTRVGRESARCLTRASDHIVLRWTRQDSSIAITVEVVTLLWSLAAI
jgi:hypothetical protein